MGSGSSVSEETCYGLDTRFDSLRGSFSSLLSILTTDIYLHAPHAPPYSSSCTVATLPYPLFMFYLSRTDDLSRCDYPPTPRPGLLRLRVLIACCRRQGCPRVQRIVSLHLRTVGKQLGATLWSSAGMQTTDVQSSPPHRSPALLSSAPSLQYYV
jgi:hypothetical protein